MPGNQDTMAQAVFLAQLEAARGTCKCNACRILRKASALMTRQFIGETEAKAGDVLTASGIEGLGPSEQE